MPLLPSEGKDPSSTSQSCSHESGSLDPLRPAVAMFSLSSLVKDELSRVGTSAYSKAFHSHSPVQTTTSFTLGA